MFTFITRITYQNHFKISANNAQNSLVKMAVGSNWIHSSGERAIAVHYPVYYRDQWFQMIGRESLGHLSSRALSNFEHDWKRTSQVARVKKKRVLESLAGSHAYNPIWDSRWDFLARKVSPTVSLKVSPRVSARLSARLLARLSDRIIYMTRGETLSESLFFTRASRVLNAQSLYAVFLTWQKYTG